MWLTMALLGGAMAAEGDDDKIRDLSTYKAIKVAYKLSFDLDSNGDATCSMTKICDCATVYEGEGKVVEVDGNRVTFEGSWKTIEDSCNEQLTMWVPFSGEAYHTVRFNRDHTKVIEWIAHGERDKVDRLTENMKSGRQYWISDMNSVVQPNGVAIHTETESQMVSVITLSSAHHLTLRLAE